MFKTIGVSIVMLTFPFVCIGLCYISTTGTTLLILIERLMQNSGRALDDIWEHSLPTMLTAKTLAFFWMLAMILYWLPGPTKTGPLTSKGHEPKYMDNAISHVILFPIVYVLGSIDGFYPMSILFDELLSMIVVLNVGAILFCILLYIKGRVHPSTDDVTFSGNGLVYDFYAGIELYPRIFGYDVKKLVNCRFSMTFWMMFGISCIDASNQLHSTTDWGLFYNAILTFVYLFKFFTWEIGYMRSIDIIEDNAGFMETWGCLVFVPAFYTNHLHYSVKHPSQLSFFTATTMGLFGLICICLNYWTDRQRQVFRDTEGRSMLWWPTSPKALRVDYDIVNEDGTKTSKEALLLVNGFWGIVRHPQYIFELGIACTWGLLGNPIRNGLQPLLYFFFLTCLLVHRAHRDTERCKLKYGAGYKTYMANVPYTLIPGVY